MYSVDLVSDSAAFLALREEWNDAVERAGVAHPFLRHEWLRAWWDAFGGGRRLHVLVARRSGRVAAIAPLMFERARMYGVPLRRVRFLQNDHTPRADVIAPDRSDEAYAAIWHALQDGRPRWDLLQLSQLPAESISRDVFRTLARLDGHATGVWESGASPYVELGTTWSRYTSSLSSKFRQNLRNRLGRLSQIGEPVLEVLDDPAAIRESWHDAQRLEESGWKGGAGTAIGSDPAVQRFYSLLAGRAAECDWLRLLFLTVNGRRIAGSFAAVYDNRLFLLKTGYDPELAKCSPFKLLMYFALQYACERGFCEVDLLGDPEPWKLEWTASTRGHDWLFVFSGTPRGRLLHPLKFQFIPALRQLCTSQPSRA